MAASEARKLLTLAAQVSGRRPIPLSLATPQFGRFGLGTENSPKRPALIVLVSRSNTTRSGLSMGALHVDTILAFQGLSD